MAARYSGDLTERPITHPSNLPHRKPCHYQVEGTIGKRHGRGVTLQEFDAECLRVLQWKWRVICEIERQNLILLGPGAYFEASISISFLVPIFERWDTSI